MGMYKYLSKFWQDNAEMDSLMKERMIKWRRQPVIIKIENPTRLDKARMLGYKAKQGFVVARARLIKGGRRRPAIPKGRRPKRYGLRHFSTIKSLQSVAEQKVNRRFPNLEVLNSYYVGDDGRYVWYEIIMLDKQHTAIKKDKDVKWIVDQRGRAHRGLTSAGRRSKNSRGRAR